MDDIGIGLGGLALLFVLIGLRVPIGVALIGVSFAGLYVLAGLARCLGGTCSDAVPVLGQLGA